MPIQQSVFQSLTIHVWYIYLHLPYFTIKNNHIYLHLPYFTIKNNQFTYIYHILPLKTTIHVGKYASPMDGKGMEVESPEDLYGSAFVYSIQAGTTGSAFCW